MSDPRPDDVTVDRVSTGVALVAIERARCFNTLSVDTLEALDDALRPLVADPDLVALVLFGAGGESFAAGADIREVAALAPRAALAFAARGQRVFDLIERAPKVVFAAIDGYAMGGGLDLALACDVRHASPRSVFAHPGSKLGIITGFGGTARLPRLVGTARAIELFATGRRIDAAEAERIGLIDRVVDDPKSSAIASASAIAERWPVASAALKGSVLRWWRKGHSHI